MDPKALNPIDVPTGRIAKTADMQTPRRTASREPGGVRRAHRAGWLVSALIAPQLILGTYLAVVPDRVSFTASQVVVLAHVALATLTIPVVALFAIRHVRGLRRPIARWRTANSMQWALATATLAAYATGFILLWSSEGMAPARWHSIAGAAIAVPLALHFAFAGRRTAAVVTALGLGLTLASALGLKSYRAATPLHSPDPAFSYAQRPAELYDSAAWCGECHQENYAEWAQSTHGRAMVLPNVLAEFHEERNKVDLGADLALLGRAAAGEHVNDFSASGCRHCHAPTAFYGKFQGDVLSAGPPHSDGVTCSFCHTLRGVRANVKFGPFIERLRKFGQESVSISERARGLPLYISAPETVRRYFGQGSSHRVLRWMGNMLIRWRPEMHRRDYHAPFLNTAEACQGCHGAGGEAPETPHKTYADWETSTFADENVLCQDCHMTPKMTGQPVMSPGALVPWGPVRKQRRPHDFLGGNANAALRMNDSRMAGKEHALSRAAVRLVVESADRVGDVVRVAVRVSNDLVGHRFPGMETVQRFAWVEIALLDASGAVLTTTCIPQRVEDLATCNSPSLYRTIDSQHLVVTSDTTLAPKESRLFRVDLPLPGATFVHVRAKLRMNFDPEPIAEHTSPQ